MLETLKATNKNLIVYDLVPPHTLPKVPFIIDDGNGGHLRVEVSEDGKQIRVWAAVFKESEISK